MLFLQLSDFVYVITHVVLSGLKDLADFLPASLATIVSYFSSEVSRGVWKPVFMNGVDWPSPATNLSNVEEYIKKILATTGVDIPSLAPGKNSERVFFFCHNSERV